MKQNNDIGQHLKTLRKLKNYSQEEVAEHLHIIRQTYSHYETGRIEPPLKVLQALAGLYDVPLEALLGQEQKDMQQMNTFLTDSELEFIRYYRMLTEQDREDLLLFALIKGRRRGN